ncbi:repulsive guidance molecule A-like isoform X2 [Planococcus citri]
MDWLLRPLVFFGIFICVFGAKECLYERCSNTYKESMEEKEIYDPEPSKAYCDIVKTYLVCLREMTKACRGNLNYHGTVHGMNLVNDIQCKPSKGNSNNSNTNRGNNAKVQPSSTSRPLMLPSCKFFGSYKFHHCGLYGDPHLKTFDGLYQTCRVSGQWTLIDNPYMSVTVTSAPVTDGSHATAPIKISIWVKGRDTPCTLDKHYEADSKFSLPPTFTDGSDRSGSDNTVTLQVDSFPEEDRESAEIQMRYIASRLFIRRKGKYLAFNAKIPDEIVQLTRSYDDSKTILCSTGCPASEQLNPILARGHVIEREEAFKLCKSMENSTGEMSYALTDNYLDWCVFDVMTAGRDTDFIDAAHLAQFDALKLDLPSLQNRTTLLEIPSGLHFNGGAGSVSRSFQLPFFICSLMLICSRYLSSL